MGGGGVVQVSHIVTHVNDYDPEAGILTRISRFYFGLDQWPPPPERPLGEADFAGPPVERRGRPSGKIAIRLDEGLAAGAFLIRFEGTIHATIPDRAVADEATETFGGPGWSGYLVELPRPAGRIDDLAVLLKIKGTFERRRRMSVASLVFGFFEVPFDTHHALGLTVLQRESAVQVDTSVRQRS